MAAALEFDRVSVVFPPRERGDAPWRAIAHTSLSVEAGEFVSVVGPTGCGKSTLLNLAAGLLHPTEGEVRVFGEMLTGLNRRAGYMFQADALLPWRTALENVLFGLELRGVPRGTSQDSCRLIHAITCLLFQLG